MNVLIKLKYEHPLRNLSINDFIQKLTSILAGRVEEAYLFGSIATNTLRDDSDVDLIIVCNTKLDFHHRFKQFEDIYDFIPRLDLLIYTPIEWSKINAENKVGFWKDVFKNKIKIA